MPELYASGQRIETFFELLGSNENDMTRSLGWALSRSPRLLQRFLQETIQWTRGVSSTEVRLQTFTGLDGKQGFTDIELETVGEFCMVIEAKKGWVLPTIDQLDKYAEMLTTQPSGSKKCLVVLTHHTEEYMKQTLPHSIRGIEICPLSWTHVQKWVRYETEAKGASAEKRLLNDLSAYLGGIHMQRIDSNMVYVVSLGKGTPEGWTVSWRDIVNRNGYYFHPVGKGFPTEPQNYMAFRYDGKLQSIHHVEKYEVVSHMHPYIPEIRDEIWEPHFLYTLGPAIRPNHEVKAGKGVIMAATFRCMLDTLLTSATIRDAVTLTNERLNAGR